MEDSPSEPRMPAAHPSILKVIEQKKRVKEKLSGIKHKIGIYSAKGGVGKTTTAVNIAYTLKEMGYKVGLLDADVDCPNLTMFLGINEILEGNYPLIPIEKDGIKVLSTAMFVDDVKRPIIWRGPMIGKMIAEFFENSEWGELDYLIIDLPPGCLPKGTLILTADNYPKPIEEIKAGDVLLSYDGKGLVKDTVREVFIQGRQGVYRIKTPNRIITASANHPFLKYNWTNNLSWKQVNQLKVKDRIVVVNNVEGQKPLILPHFRDSKHNTKTHILLPTVTTENFMKIIGHFVGDGYIKINHKQNRINGLRICEPKDSRFYEKYISLYKDVFKGCNIFPDGKSQFAVDSLPLVRLFEHLDLNHHALEKRIPTWVFSLPVRQRRAFVEGYSEADGHIRHRENEKLLMQPDGTVAIRKIIQDTVNLASTNEYLIRQLHELCQISGIRATNIRRRFKEGNFIGERKIKDSINYEFDYSMKFDEAKFKLGRIKEIEFSGYEQTYDIRMEKYQNFVANGALAHNTSDAPLSIIQLLDLDGFILVTTPQHIATVNTMRSGGMARRLGAGILGVVENMSDGKGTGGKAVAKGLECEFLGMIRLNQKFNEFSDKGRIPALEDQEIRKEYIEIVNKIVGR